MILTSVYLYLLLRYEGIMIGIQKQRYLLYFHFLQLQIYVI